MEDIKDTQRTDSISRFLDAHPVRTNPFGDNRAAERAYRRAERLAAALYLLTNHIPENDRAREETRRKANELLEHVLCLRDEMRSPQSPAIRSTTITARHLISLVRMLTIAGYVSIQNAETMVAALDELSIYLTSSQRSILSESVSISREELMDVHESSQRTRTVVQAIKDTHEVSVITDTQIVKDAKTSAPRVSRGSSLSLRSQTILDILRTGGSLGIKDIAANLPEYGEKTIQRELVTLVSEGKVRKVGLKRWSRYSIAQ